MKNDDLHRILIKGGVTSPGELKDGISLLKQAGLSTISFGSRQDLLFPLSTFKKSELEQGLGFSTQIVSDRSYQNIVSSYVSADIFDNTYWLKGSTYLYILEEFDFDPKLKINITDPKQRLVPILNGNLNFIASEQEDYWYLNILLPHWKKRAYYPVLVYSWDIVKISKAIENVYASIDNVDQLFSILNQSLQTNNRSITNPLEVPFVTFPYYEGMNRMGLDKYWLGLYWRNNDYDLGFLKDFCGFCLDNSIGKISITPWKSFIVKSIPKESRPELERFLGQRGINVRHSQLEMNWHLPVDDLDALELKKDLVKHFNENDISTYGLTFGISNDVGKRSHFSSIIIEKNPISEAIKEFKGNPTFNVLHFKNFDPSSDEYVLYAQDVDKKQLGQLLMELSKKYFNDLTGTKERPKENRKSDEVSLRSVFQCQSCFTVYDESLGDSIAKVSAGTSFEKLPDSFVCSVCNAPKSEFQRTDLKLA
ncbi:rubredoxin [Flagellimonas sp. CMM7]|nr:rubredoxin [Flagellimonas sp. CMM7]UII81865.1 rubredoxin [Flagellimonas sp. CMM7]